MEERNDQLSHPSRLIFEIGESQASVELAQTDKVSLETALRTFGDLVYKTAGFTTPIEDYILRAETALEELNVRHD